MRRVMLEMHVAIDGHVRAASGEVMDWNFRTHDEALMAWKVERLRRHNQ